MKSKLLSLFLLVFAGNILCGSHFTKEDLHTMSLKELRNKRDAVLVRLKSTKEGKNLIKQIDRFAKLEKKHREIILKAQNSKNSIIIHFYFLRLMASNEKRELQLAEIQRARERLIKINPDLALLIGCILEKERAENEAQ